MASGPSGLSVKRPRSAAKGLDRDRQALAEAGVRAVEPSPTIADSILQ